VRLATAEEAIVFGRAAESTNPSNDLMLAYLVELDADGTNINFVFRSGARRN